MEESPKLDLSSCYYGCGDHAFEMEQKNTPTQRMSVSVSDHMNGFQYPTEKFDSYVIDMDAAFSSGINKDSSANANPRITKGLQRSLSRKGSQRGVDRKVNGLSMLQVHDINNKDAISALCSPLGSCTPTAMAAGSPDHSINPHNHHQINIIGTTTATTGESRLTRRNSFIRSSSWTLDPKRVLIFFATLSSMGTMLLIYFTLISNKQNFDGYVGDIGSSE
ncbi:hypothetical protein MtrunA17_Chr5g0394061 [Medicago truncatula]|uniref:Transmembrane protein, putative n=1 Tax=Medicago truncatula TaxID=3880 RepID=G7K108_MEDTR|nr:uncharacterized protein LOC11440417 isoform X2 [Medicago truncatula]AES93616.2 transmembrane protein, putative [Medicago truncatula]RHN53268.1 hypothetical protein MtrunA17_Chr5g0394061 [Medicago truncatula]